jgi:hypothetical protein
MGVVPQGLAWDDLGQFCCPVTGSFVVSRSLTTYFISRERSIHAHSAQTTSRSPLKSDRQRLKTGGYGRPFRLMTSHNFRRTSKKPMRPYEKERTHNERRTICGDGIKINLRRLDQNQSAATGSKPICGDGPKTNLRRWAENQSAATGSTSICRDGLKKNLRTVRVSPHDSEVLVFQFERDAVSIIADDPPGLVASVVAWPELTWLIVLHCSFSPWPLLKGLFGNVSGTSALEVNHPPDAAFVQFVKFGSTHKTGPMRRLTFCGSDFDASFMVQLAILIETNTVNSLAFLNRVTHDGIRVISEMVGDKLKILIPFPLPSRSGPRWRSNFFSPRNFLVLVYILFNTWSDKMPCIRTGLVNQGGLCWSLLSNFCGRILRIIQYSEGRLR